MRIWIHMAWVGIQASAWMYRGWMRFHCMSLHILISLCCICLCTLECFEYLCWMEHIFGFTRIRWYRNIDMHLPSILLLVLLSFTVLLTILRSNLLILRRTMVMMLQVPHLRGNMHLYRGICPFLYAQCVAPRFFTGVSTKLLMVPFYMQAVCIPFRKHITEPSKCCWSSVQVYN